MHSCASVGEKTLTFITNLDFNGPAVMNFSIILVQDQGHSYSYIMYKMLLLA